MTADHDNKELTGPANSNSLLVHFVDCDRSEKTKSMQCTVASLPSTQLLIKSLLIILTQSEIKEVCILIHVHRAHGNV